ncbi:MAG TPA: LysR family transcriptional regulator, partial [Gammaproteobacteria bacterium]
MKLQHLRFFTAVVECGGVIKAAERLHLTQPAVSTGLRALEDELGGALFHRGTQRRLSLTPAGRRFYRHALAILQQCDSARADFAGQGEEGVAVRIGVLDTLSQTHLLGLLARLAERQPQWKVEIWEGSMQRLTTWLGQGRIDLAWTNIHDQSDGQRLLWREPLVAVVASPHSFAMRPTRAIAIEELASEPFVHRSRCELDALGRAQLRAAGITLHVVARAERDELAFQLVRDGRAITLAPHSLVPAD